MKIGMCPIFSRLEMGQSEVGDGDRANRVSPAEAVRWVPGAGFP